MFLLKAFFAVVVMPFSAQAQLEKGNYLYGGSGYAVIPNVRNSTKSGTTFLEAKGGYFIANNLAIGPVAQYTFDFTTFNRNTSQERRARFRTMSFGVFARPYFTSANAKWNVFGEIHYQYGFVREIVNRVGVEVTRRTTSNYGRIAVGYSYFLQPNVALECTYGLERYRLKDEAATQFGQRITLGFLIYLRK